MDPHIKEFSFGSIQKERGVFVVRLFEDAEFDIATIKQLMEWCIAASAGERFCILVDANSHAKASPETRNFAANAGYNKHIIARAIMTRSLAMKMAANFFIRFNRPNVETRLFTNETEALHWLNKKQLLAGVA